MEDSLLLPPVGVWAVSQSNVADYPLRSATYHRLGKPLPYQLTNTPRVRRKVTAKGRLLHLDHVV